ncbi:MAG: hypothetical protein MJ162_06945 [Treponema sp.]|nr:hypothetical protein [Treponema sp.]
MPQFFIPTKEQLQITEQDFSEAARYLGYQRLSVPDQTIKQLIEECIQELSKAIKPQAVFEYFPVEVNQQTNEISFADVKITSKNLTVNLKNSKEIVLLAATIGPQVDALIRRTQATNPAKAAVFQSCGAMYIEKIVDLLNDFIKETASAQKKACRPRFSPGFGDVPLETQKEFFRLLPCTRIGLTLMDTLIMSPEKSVTAFIGIYKD